MRKKRFIFFLLPVLSLLLTSCLTSRLERKLKPADQDWLSEVRYIITPEERKIFLELPESEREKFKEDFWARRDPDPDTEINEFKDEYYQRLNRANQMFMGEGRPGWLTDRGRIYILFGPPTERYTYPMEASGYCREVWYYGSFPVIFIDEHCSGNFIISAINLEHLQDLNLAQGYFQNTITQERSVFNYDLKLTRSQRTGDSLKAKLIFSMKYEQIWFETRDDASLETQLYLSVEIKNAAGETVWSGQKTAHLTFTDEEELEKMRGLKFTMEVEIYLPDERYPLPPPGKYRMYSTLKQRTGGKELKKVAEIKL
ncbi:MAG: GWxTD domain-containing protein [Candidatus Saccharicenans sp.]|nr:GWxTD domain-containing protein [Candidatus Saccharicenans sp.]MDI6849101.1 GWxTD domain-containing protein [Candidatus Saccharicenans sp.]